MGQANVSWQTEQNAITGRWFVRVTCEHDHKTLGEGGSPHNARQAAGDTLRQTTAVGCEHCARISNALIIEDVMET